jgi:RNA polymerase sigma-54 factor
LNLTLDMSLKLQQKLSFQMIQSLKLLQVNAMQLEQLIRTELEINPVLETDDEVDAEQETVEEEKEKKEEEPAEKELETGEDEIDWEEYLEEGFDMGGQANEEVDHNEQRYDPTPVYQTSLDEHLTNQLSEKNLDAELRLLVEFIIGCIGSDGYLRISVEDIVDATKSERPRVDEALTLVQRMDPPGVGCQSLQECLMLQLKARGLKDSLAMRIIMETWELFEKVKIPDIARTFGVTNKEVQDAIEVLKTLNPKPGYQINPENASTIIPDLVVEKVNDDFVVMINDRSAPSLRISRSYLDVIRRGSKAQKDVKDYVRDKLNSATWLIRSIEQRQNTMIRVMSAIIARQREFFEKGPPNLSPLKLQDIATMVEMHISTVSRVTNGKYVQTPHGIFELKYFFTEGISRESDGTDISSERIKNRIRELVENEDTKKPLSDQKIAEILSREDLAVARRTVAKYREQHKILPARLRQKYV